MSHGSYSHPFSRNDQSLIARWFWTVDRGLLGAALALMGLGVSLSFASSPAAILADESITDPFHYSWRMIVFAGVGLTIMLTTSLMSPRGVRRRPRSTPPGPPCATAADAVAAARSCSC